MTRINIIPPEELYDQHLIAEYREIFMVPGSLRRVLKSKIGYQSSKISSQYTLNKGHVYFFFDKGLYLEKRYNLIIKEMQKRGMNPDVNRLFPKDSFPEKQYKDWMPSEKEMNIARERIELRINEKPNWYRKTPPHQSRLK